MGASDDPPDEITVVHVDGYRAFADLSSRMLERTSQRLSVESTRTAEEAMEAVQSADADCVVSAYDLPETDGLALLDWVRATRPGLPFVLFTGCREPRLRREALYNGATAIVVKETDPGQFATLADRIVGAVSNARGRPLALPADGVVTPGDGSA